MNKEIYLMISKNPSLLRFNNLDLDFIFNFILMGKYDKKVKNYLDKNKVELADAFIANNKLTYEKLSNRLTEMFKKENLEKMIKENHKELNSYCSPHNAKVEIYKQLIKDMIIIESMLVRNNFYLENSDLVRLIIQSSNSDFLIKLMIEEKTFNKTFIAVLDNNHINASSILKKFKMEDSFFKFLIEKNHSIINPETQMDSVKRKEFFNCFDVLPKFLEEYLKEDRYQKAMSTQKSEQDIIDRLFRDYSLLYTKLCQLQTSGDKKDLEYFYSKLSFFHLSREHQLKHQVPQEIVYRAYDEIKSIRTLNLELGIKDLSRYFLNRLDTNLRLITCMHESLIKRKYTRIRASILNGSPIGKQGLKYFLVKNKQKIDVELAEYVLNKYPKLFNSLKLSFPVNFKPNTIKGINIKELKNKKTLTEEEYEFAKNNISIILKMNFDKINNEQLIELAQNYFKIYNI